MSRGVDRSTREWNALGKRGADGDDAAFFLKVGDGRLRSQHSSSHVYTQKSINVGKANVRDHAIAANPRVIHEDV